MREWFVLAGFGYALVAAGLVFVLSPQCKTASDWSRLMFDAAIWPGWALVIMVEATEEARRNWRKRRVE